MKRFFVLGGVAALTASANAHTQADVDFLVDKLN